jgi:hypothetical protein
MLLPGALAYRPLFLLSAAGSLLCCALILRTPDSKAHNRKSLPNQIPAKAQNGRRTEWSCAS